jgi:hypothetical protein
MSRKARVNRTVRRALERQLQKLEAKKPSHRNRLWRALAFVIGIPGVFAALVTFLPRVSVAATDPVDQTQPFTSSFTITNESIFPLRDVGAGFGIIESNTMPVPFDEQNRPRLKPRPDMFQFTLPQWNGHSLDLNDKFSINTEHLYGLGGGAILSGADIYIVVHYQPWVIPWKRTRVFRFVTHHYKNGSYTWLSFPLD